MVLRRTLGLVVICSLLSGSLRAADVILNEYNAVDTAAFLGGGDSSADEAGGRAADSFFGRVPGNGGDWFELVVIKDHLDMRGWQLDIFAGGKLEETLTLTAQPIWSDLRAGTIITVAEDVPSDVSYDPAAGDWWINVWASTDADGKYISAKSFPVSNKNWQLRIRNISGAVVFGPAGEGDRSERQGQRYGGLPFSRKIRAWPSRPIRRTMTPTTNSARSAPRIAGARRISTIFVPP